MTSFCMTQSFQGRHFNQCVKQSNNRSSPSSLHHCSPRREGSITDRSDSVPGRRSPIDQVDRPSQLTLLLSNSLEVQEKGKEEKKTAHTEYDSYFKNHGTNPTLTHYPSRSSSSSKRLQKTTEGTTRIGVCFVL